MCVQYVCADMCVADDSPCIQLGKVSLFIPPPGPGGVETAVVIGVVVAVATVIILLLILAVFVTVLVCLKHKTTSESERRWGGWVYHSLAQCVCR